MSSFTLILCSVWALFFEKNLHKAILSHFPCQSFTKSKSQDTLILGLSAGSGNCCKKYEGILKSNLNGFRLLFLTNTTSRFTALCGLTQELRPSDFVWLTDQKKMFSDGLSGNIWARGGRNNDPPQSIVGPSLAWESPTPSFHSKVKNH